jgi:hypothetical protein
MDREKESSPESMGPSSNGASSAEDGRRSYKALGSLASARPEATPRTSFKRRGKYDLRPAPQRMHKYEAAEVRLEKFIELSGVSLPRDRNSPEIRDLAAGYVPAASCSIVASFE